MQNAWAASAHPTLPRGRFCKKQKRAVYSQPAQEQIHTTWLLRRVGIYAHAFRAACECATRGQRVPTLPYRKMFGYFFRWPFGDGGCLKAACVRSTHTLQRGLRLLKPRACGTHTHYTGRLRLGLTGDSIYSLISK